MEAVHKGMIVAQNNNSGWLREVGHVKNLLLDAKNILDGALLKVQELESRGQVGTELFDSMEQAVRPEETEISQILADSVVDCADADHN